MSTLELVFSRVSEDIPGGEAGFAAARALFETGPVRVSAEARAKADAFFREVVRGR